MRSRLEVSSKRGKERRKKWKGRNGGRLEGLLLVGPSENAVHERPSVKTLQNLLVSSVTITENHRLGNL